MPWITAGGHWPLWPWRVMGGDELVGPGRRGPRRKRGGSGGRRHMGHAQATTRPQSDLGRVSIDWCISTALLPLSYALTAPVAGVLGARDTLHLAGRWEQW